MFAGLVVVEKPTAQGGDCLDHQVAEGSNVGLTVLISWQLAGPDYGSCPTSVQMYYWLAKMLISGQFTMNPVDWNVLLVAPVGVMLWACAGTSASARLKSVCRNLLASGTEAFHCRKWMSHIGL